MAGDKRRVDSAVLRDLAGATQAKRDRLDTFYNECRSRVDSAPRGWSTGEWDGTHTFMLHELQQMDKERQELVDRARIVDVAAALAVLPNPLSAWRSFLKLFQPASSTPNRPWTAQDQALFERARMIQGLAKKSGYTLTQDEFLKLRDGSLGEKELGIAVSGLMVASVAKRLGYTLTSGQSIGLVNAGLGVAKTEEAIKTMRDSKQIYQIEAANTKYADVKRDIKTCGPSSLIMLLGALGIAVSGSDSQDKVNVINKSLYSNGQEPTTAQYKAWIQTEPTSLAKLGEVAKTEFRTSYIDLNGAERTESTIKDSLISGKKVLVNGTYGVVSDGNTNSQIALNSPWLIEKFGDIGSQSLHIVAISGYNASTNKYTILDPLRKTPVEVPWENLKKFMSGGSEAVVVGL